MIRFILNEKEISTGLSRGMTLLDFIRYQQKLTGTKIGCREGDCGACTVLIGEIKNSELDYKSMTSCLVPLGNVHGKHVVTIEGINFQTDDTNDTDAKEPALNPIQQAMADAGATQCGFCTPGFVMSLAGFCLSGKEVLHQSAIAAIDGNICRCTGYKSIERAAFTIAELLQNRQKEDPANFLSRLKILPEYFTTIKTRLATLGNGQLKAMDSKKPVVVGGGTDLYVQKPEVMTDAAIRFVFDHPKLNGISKDGNKCIIGPSATVTDLLESPVINQAFPEFPLIAKLISSTPIRNMATIAGNFVNASPIGDFTIFFLALDAQLQLRNGKKKRELPLRKFYKAYKQLDKKPEEYIEKIWFQLPGKDSLFNFEKVSKRQHLDIASVNSAIYITMNGERIGSAGISAGGVGPVPLFLKKTSEFLKDKLISEDLAQETVEIAEGEISPISDARGTKEYKTLLLGQLIKAHFMSLFPRLEVEKVLS